MDVGVRAMLTAISGGDPLAAGIEQGWIRPPLHAGGLEPATPVSAMRRVLDVVDEDRSAD